MKNLFFIFFGITLSACQTDSAGHLPASWQLPGATLGSVFENTVYGVRRRKVENFIAQNYDPLTSDIQAQSGPFLDRAFDLARVAPARRGELLHNIHSRPDIYFAGPETQNIECLVVAFMVYGGD